MSTKLADLSYLDYLSRLNEEFLGQVADLIKAHVPKSHYTRLDVKTGPSRMTILHYDGTDGSDHLLDIGMSVHQTAGEDGRDSVRIIVVGASAYRGRIAVDVTRGAAIVTPNTLFRMFKNEYGR
jgi:hypothetical protein